MRLLIVEKMESAYFRKSLIVLVIGVLLVLAFLILKPILMSIIFGFIMAFILSPIYNFFLKITKKPNLSATIVILLLVIVILLPIWFIVPLVINQVVKLYLVSQQVDYSAAIGNLFPSLIESGFAASFGNTIQNFVIKAGSSVLEQISQLILNLPLILLQLIVILFTLYFALRDKKLLLDYVKSLSPFSREIENKLFKSSKDITASVLYGQVVVGIIQGVIIGIAFFLFGIPSASLLTFLAIIFGILPIIGPMFIWVPVFVYLLIIGDVVSAVGILIFGIISSNIDNVLRTIFVSRFTKLHSSIVLIGMIGGLFVFGILGLILGPLVLAYLIILIDVYRSGSGGMKGTPFLMKGD